MGAGEQEAAGSGAVRHRPGRDGSVGSVGSVLAAPDATLELVVALHRLIRGLSRSRHQRALQPTQLIVLALLYEHGPCRLGVIAERVPCSQPTATASVAGLESAGLVRREPDATDGRATRIALTEEGGRMLLDVAQGEAAALADRLAMLAPADARRVLEVGPLLRLLAEPVPGQRAPGPRES